MSGWSELAVHGTPEIAEFAAAELGAVLRMSPFAAAGLVADALDLRHRLPRLWARVQAGDVKPWIARRVAEATRSLSADTAAVVDRRVAPWAHSLSWGRIENIIDAVVIEADPAAAAEAVEAAEVALGVWLSPSNDHGIKDVHIRAEAPDAIWFDGTVDRVADGLELLGDARSKDARRAAAVGVLARPQQALDVFDQAAATASGRSTQPEESTSPGPPAATGNRPPATLYIHLSQAALQSGTGVARVEGVGPISLQRVQRWLGHTRVTVKPVIDLANQVPVDAYEVPDRLREAVHLRSPVDVFPYATSTRRGGDIDHTIPYVCPDNGGPPGQTRTDNLAPMIRFHHRIKTKGRWQVSQPFDGVFIWRSPHGRFFLVDSTGTSPILRAAA
ncbi:MAG: DUF222 domain-containing protein [Nocardioidaceae bacterium]